MAKNKKSSFNIDAIDDVIGDFQNQVEKLEKEKEKALEKIEFHNEQTELGASFNQHFNPVEMYSSIEDVMKHSVDLMIAEKQMISSMPDGEGLSGFASLISSINSTFSEFSAIYKDQIRYNNAYNLEMLKFENKKKLEEFKHNLKQTAPFELEDAPKVSFNTHDIINQVVKAEQNLM